jgi:hypothetical protein
MMSKSSLLQYHQQHLILSSQTIPVLSVEPISYLPYPTLITLLPRYNSLFLAPSKVINMRRGIAALAICASVVSAQSTTSIDIDAISVAIPTTVFNLPVVYVTAEDAPTITATTLATTAIPSSDPSATNVFDSPADVTAALSSASVIAAATSSAAVDKRAATTCVPQPAGINYAVQPDTAAGWVADLNLPASATAANKALPTGYVSSFVALNASNSADNYMGFTLMTSYDVAGCATKCNPDDSSCSDPPSTVQVKVIFSFPLSLLEPIANPSKVRLLGWCCDLCKYTTNHSSCKTN